MQLPTPARHPPALLQHVCFRGKLAITGQSSKANRVDVDLYTSSDALNVDARKADESDVR